MNSYGNYTPPFFVRYEREIKQSIAIFIFLALGMVYGLIAPVRAVIDKGVDPAVEGITLLYSKTTSLIYKYTGINLGFVSIPTDQDFLFSVQLATYINERRAGPLLDIAVNTTYPIEKRERALYAILKFEMVTDWIQPFLNELSKGGLIGLYDDEAPLLDEMVKKIRAEGGVRQPLVRAYAEVVFSFMLQLPDIVVRKHAYRWVSDVVAEDALFLLIPRFEKEKDPKGQAAIESTLYEIRAVSEPETARDLIIPFYRNPPWPGLKLPLAIVLVRLGFDGAYSFIRNQMQSEALTSDQRSMLRLALQQPEYPKELSISADQKNLIAERRRLRDAQAKVAKEHHERIMKQERIKQQMLARAEKPAVVVSAPVEKKAELPINVKPEEAKQIPVEDKKAPETKQVAMLPPPPPIPAPAIPQEPIKKAPPKQFPIPGAVEKKEPPVEPIEATPPETVYLEETTPEAIMPPELEEAPKSRSLMNYVDMVFEVKKQEVPLFQNPGEGETGVRLPVGSKGKADFEVLIGEDHWYQVKSKKGSGWANGKLLSMFSLSPEGNTPAVSAKPKESTLEGERKESTYFEANADDASYFEKPSPKSKVLGKLSAETAYLAIRSEKVGPERWFLLQIRSGESAWVNGLDLRLADVQQPVELETPKKPLSLRGKQSAFQAEWVKASVKGVGVYSRPSIAAQMIQQINPTNIYKVLETSAGGGKEWYRIELGENKEGWVQTMDVSLTKKD